MSWPSSLSTGGGGDKNSASSTEGTDEGKPEGAKGQEDEIIDFIQGQMYQSEWRIKLEEELKFIQDSKGAVTMKQQGWRRTGMGSWLQELRRARRMPMPRGAALKRRITRDMDGGLIEDMR